MENRARLRRMAGLTQAQLARRVGRNHATICRWERGELDLSADDVEKIAAVIREELAKQPVVSSPSQLIGMLAGPKLAGVSAVSA